MSRPAGNLILTEEGLRALNMALNTLCQEVSGRAVLLVDKSGQLIAAQGATGSVDLLSLAALMMGAFQSTRALARVLHEKEFQVMFQQGRTESMFMSALESGDMLAVVFSDNVTVGMVKFKTLQALDSINAQLRAMYAVKGPGLGGAAAQQQLDNLF